MQPAVTYRTTTHSRVVEWFRTAKQWECRKVVRSVASPPRAVGDVVLALHLDQPRDGAVELEGAVAGDIDLFGRHFGRGDQQGARLVEGVDQDVETPGHVTLLGSEARDVFEDDRRELFGD